MKQPKTKPIRITAISLLVVCGILFIAVVDTVFASHRTRSQLVSLPNGRIVFNGTITARNPESDIPGRPHIDRLFVGAIDGIDVYRAEVPGAGLNDITVYTGLSACDTVVTKPFNIGQKVKVSADKSKDGDIVVCKAGTYLQLAESQ